MVFNPWSLYSKFKCEQNYLDGYPYQQKISNLKSHLGTMRGWLRRTDISLRTSQNPNAKKIYARHVLMPIECPCNCTNILVTAEQFPSWTLPLSITFG